MSRTQLNYDLKVLTTEQAKDMSVKDIELAFKVNDLARGQLS